MYDKILIPVDHSPQAAEAGRLGLVLASYWDAQVSGAHVAQTLEKTERLGRLHANLPEPRQSSLSDLPAGVEGTVDVLEDLGKAAGEAQIFYRPLTLEGSPAQALCEHIESSRYNLVVLGARGEGQDERRSVGSICERLVRSTRVDVMVVRETEANEEGRILVACDGSAQSYAGLLSAIEIGKHTGRGVEAVGVYDPYIHYTLFNGIVKVLTEKASKVFKFADQEKLHEEIIDTGLAKIYQAHLEVARTVAEEEGVDLKITLLDGKAFEKLLQYTYKTRPWMLVMGRIGVHSGPEMDIGSNSENLLLQAPCNLLVVSRTHTPSVDIQAAESVQWTPAAEKKMERVPGFVRGVATTAILRWAMERGHSVVTEGVINTAMGDLLPPDAAQAMGYVAEEIAIQADDLHHGKTYLCPECGYAARDYQPVACPVCKTEGNDFQRIDREVLESIGNLEEGALEEEEHPDGYKLSWTREAKEVVSRVPKGYERRRSKARIEKTARVRGLKVVSREFAADMIEQDMAETSYLSEKGERLIVEMDGATADPDDSQPKARSESDLSWTDAAWKRLCRVPGGFMRNMTRERIEEFASTKERENVDLALCEEGITEGRRMMAEMIGDYSMSTEKKKEIQADVPVEEIPEPTSDAPALSTEEQKTLDTFKSLADAARDPNWTEEGSQKLDEATERVTELGKFTEERAQDLGKNVAEQRAREKRMAEISGGFMAKLGKQLGYGHPLAEVTSQHKFTWTPEAEAELEDIPDFCREMTKWRVEWTAVKMDLGTVITPETMAVKYDMWGEVSEDFMNREGSRLEWAPETEARLDRIPDFVKGQVIESIEGNARKWGLKRVDNAVLERVIQKWIDTGDFHEQTYGYK